MSERRPDPARLVRIDPGGETYTVALPDGRTERRPITERDAATGLPILGTVLPDGRLVYDGGASAGPAETRATWPQPTIDPDCLLTPREWRRLAQLVRDRGDLSDSAYRGEDATLARLGLLETDDDAQQPHVRPTPLGDQVHERGATRAAWHPHVPEGARQCAICAALDARIDWHERRRCSSSRAAPAAGPLLSAGELQQMLDRVTIRPQPAPQPAPARDDLAQRVKAAWGQCAICRATNYLKPGGRICYHCAWTRDQSDDHPLPSDGRD